MSGGPDGRRRAGAPVTSTTRHPKLSRVCFRDPLVPDDGDAMTELRRLHAAIDDGSDVAELRAIRTFLNQERA